MISAASKGVANVFKVSNYISFSFTEIKILKIISAASEGGANVFKVSICLSFNY